MVRSTWSGGVTWSGTAKWMPDGDTGSGMLRPDVAFGGELYTGLQRASWRLGPTDFLSDLSPGTCTLSFKDYFTLAPGTLIVITSTVGALWVGRVDTCSTMWDAAQHPWTTVTGTDPLGALGDAEVSITPTEGTVIEQGLELAAEASVDVTFTDLSTGLSDLRWLPVDPYDGNVLAYINRAAHASNVMLGLQRDGTIATEVRRGVTPTDQVDVTNRYREWEEVTSIAVDINRWHTTDAAGARDTEGVDEADQDIYGRRVYTNDPDLHTLTSIAAFGDWTTYGGSQRPTFRAVFPLKSWADDDLMLLNPFSWIAEDFYGDIQVMSVEHSVSVSPPEWTVTITADQLLALL